MSKAGDKLLGAMQEAAEVARGERPASRITINGHAYVPLAEYERLRSALERIGDDSWDDSRALKHMARAALGDQQSASQEQK